MSVLATPPRVRFIAAAIVAACALCITAPLACGQSAIYEGWNYQPGTQFDIFPGTGSGWAADSGYSGAIAVVSPGLTHPAALPSSGNAMGSNADVPASSTARPFASPLDASQTLWMSFLARRDDAAATCSVSLQQISGNRTFSATFGADVDSSSGAIAYKARWENVGFFVQGGDAFAAKPTSPIGTTDLFLVRINPADVDAGSQSFDMWVNPNPAALGSPDASVAWPSAARLWSRSFYSINGAAVDELRIDADFGNVVSSVPAPATALLLALGTLAPGCRSRRAAPSAR